MAWTSTDLSNIDAAIASGTLEVRQGDKMIRYRSIEDLKNARAMINDYLAQTAGPPQVRAVRIFTDSGF